MTNPPLINTHLYTYIHFPLQPINNNVLYMHIQLLKKISCALCVVHCAYYIVHYKTEFVFLVGHIMVWLPTHFQYNIF
jgi:hypothetical protein